jgi:hypothetical protein
MENKTYKFEFNQQEVDFDQTNQNLMVNATQMAKIYDKQVNSFLRNDHTQRFISECLNNENSRYLNIKTEEDLATSKQKSGTWMHRVLALKFASWLNPAFELWVYSTIDNILFGKYKEQEESLKRSAARRNKMDLLRKDLRSYDKFLELERLQLEDDQDSYSRRNQNKNQLNLFRNFDEQTEA